MNQIVVKNQKLSKKLETMAVKQAELWLTKYAPEVVATGIWNKYGFLADVTSRNTLKIGTFAEIQL